MIKNDPLPSLFEAFNTLYSDSENIEVWFTDPSLIKDDYGVPGKGVTVFPHDGSDPIIYLDKSLPIENVTEILAHEMAHVIAGPDAGHGDRWSNAFDALKYLYDEDMKRRFGAIEEWED